MSLALPWMYYPSFTGGGPADAAAAAAARPHRAGKHVLVGKLLSGVLDMVRPTCLPSYLLAHLLAIEQIKLTSLDVQRRFKVLQARRDRPR